MPEFRFEPEAYTPSGIRFGLITAQEARKEYSRLRAVAVKRLQRLKGTEGEQYSAYRRYGKEGFAKLDQITSEGSLARELTAVYDFLNLRTSSIGAIRSARRQSLDTLRERGFTFLNKGNIREFGEFMESARQQKIINRNAGGSDEIVELFQTVKRLALDPKEVERNFAAYMRKRGELEALPTPKSKNKATNTKAAREALGIKRTGQEFADARRKSAKKAKKRR